MNRWSLVLAGYAGLLGACGIGAGAAAAHISGGGPLDTAANYLLIHAAAIAAISLNRASGRTFLGSATVLAAGITLFSGDLALRALLGMKIFPMAAPLGGMILIAGWLTLSFASLIHLFVRK